ncbi:hypothetical protein PHLGIDRAFT_125248 [Phlebiopsis gigantea 11061_1 CR5-6]|uniref:Uncharacterized protein n=1 Tax=Phlebiopsis gigantea (strain 11061_1 CR5-6) TaxID=745531 RepID=A0A0C3S4Y1_PHLG1|nr:hypothetical protein PHLGIDRAFT_125248 [Phlebiopsis gigantea 11061_1 CR5-6]
MAPSSSSSKKPPPSKSTSKAVVPVGPREVIKSTKHSAGTKRDEYGNKPSDVRALVLRNGKHGSMGTGELVSSRIRMSGREKLDLLAEDLMQRYAQAVAPRFNSTTAVKIAEAKFLESVDDIQDLQDSELFHNIIALEVRARHPYNPSANKKTRAVDPLTDPKIVANVVSSRIHNAYMLTASWRLAGAWLTDICDAGFDHDQVKGALHRDSIFRARYLVLYDLVSIIVNANQQKFAVLATSAPHWTTYFKPNSYKRLGDDQPEFVFDWGQLKSVHKSFLDSIIVELCFPQSLIPKAVLLGILSEAIDETPRDAKRFPQALWDAMGDLSMSVQLQELLESPLLSEEGQNWLKEPREKQEDYLEWEDAQIFSLNASKDIDAYKDFLVPLTKTREKHVLETVWKYINLNYQGICGKTVEDLWGLSDLKHRAPAWHGYFIPTAGDAGKDQDDDGPPALVPYSGNGKQGKGGKKPLAITSGHDSDGGSMPSLQTVSDSSDDMDYVSEDDDDDDDGEFGTDDEDSEFDEECEDHIRDMVREAMDIAQADPDFNDPRRQAAVFEDMSAEKKDNPFLKLLGSLRGRLFSGGAALKATDRAQPRNPYTGPKPSKDAYKPAMPSAKPASAKTTKKSKAPQPQGKSQAATVEEVSDEDETTTSAKKKKKKPKKKKKKPTAEASEEPLLTPASPTFPHTPAPTVPTPPASPQKKAPTKPVTAKAPSVQTVTSSTVYGSTASLPLPTEQTAQSARTYLKSEGLDAEKSKIKTRADHATLFTIPEKKKGLFSRWTKPKSDKAEVNQKGAHSLFNRLSKRATTWMHQLMNSAEDEKQGLASMKWDHFVKLMGEMGFTYVPSTAGSSVRFDPFDPKDRPITFHKPHPDSTIHPVMLKEFGKRLRRTYGWSEEAFNF